MKTKIFALAGLALVAAACNKENAPQINENGRVTVSFNANPSTKVVYTEDAAGEYYNIDWSPKEEVGLVAVDAADPTSHSDLFKFTRVHDNVFTGEVTPWEGNKNISGVWPYDPARPIVQIPQGYWGAGTLAYFADQRTPVTVPAGDDEYDHTMLLAYGTDRKYNKIGNLHFHQMYSIVKMNVTGVPAGARVESVEMRASGDVLYGKTVGVTSYFNLTLGESDAGFNGQVAMNVSGTENGQDCIINLPMIPTTGLEYGGVTDGDAYIFTVTLSNGDSFEKTLASKVMLKSGHVYKLNMPLEELNVKDLSADGTANCYIVNKYGPCKFDATKKGHTSESVGTIESAEVLWESFGNDVQPAVGDIVSNVSVENGIVSFTASGKDGNAVIAVKDAQGNILWSWHIWVCKDFDPVATAQVYNNNAGTMMDRNLGATSAAKGDVKALGMMYQWGRKDPFLGSSSISSDTQAKSTITWPSAVESDASNGTIDFVVKHPTTFVTRNSNNSDWYYTGSSSTDNTRWHHEKGMYDPCPKGWRVPDGDSYGVWSRAFGTSGEWKISSGWDSTNIGMDFGTTDKTLGSGSIWYPASGSLDADGSLQSVDYYGNYWSCSPYNYNLAYYLFFARDSWVFASCTYSGNYRASGKSVRCLAE